MELVIEGLRKKYKDKVAVANLDLQLNNGVYGLLGANGAGKTTLMKMICGILPATEGVITCDGVNIMEMGEAYREKLGYLPQEFGYYPNFTALDFMLYIASLKGLTKDAAKKESERLLELVALSDVKKKKIKTFSGGMKQRLGIAQAMLNNPSVLILDEPTAGLDPKERVRFRNLISDLAADRLVILSTHIVGDVEYIADEILVMKGGSIVQKGTVPELVKSINDKVWKVVTDGKTADALCEKYCITNLHHNAEGMVELRIISDDKPADNAISQTPSLEDLYLYVFEEEEKEEA